MENDLSPIYLRQNNSSSNNNNAIPSPSHQLPLLGPIKISSSNVIEGRGLVATKDIQPGECLFVIQPAVTVPVEEVKRVWLKNKWKGGVMLNNNSKKLGGGGGNSGGENGNGKEMIFSNEEVMIDLTQSLEQIAQVILIKRIKRILKSNDKTQRIAAKSILSQVGDHFGRQDGCQTNNIQIVAGVEASSNICVDDDGIDDNHNHEKSSSKTASLSNDEILSIIHRNAFGPDYRQYQSIVQNWIRHPEKNPYGRILSLYPLAAMINHSCTPNAIRVYSCSRNNNNSNGGTSARDENEEEVMIVHATKPIKEGEEIVWSYVPTTKPYHDRQRRLKENFGFESKCHRSQMEALIFETHNNLSTKFDEYAKLNEAAMNIHELPPLTNLRELMTSFETIIGDKCIPSETSRYLRAGMVTFYTNYFNAILSQCDDDNVDETKASMLNLASKMHLSLVSVDHGTTEHLSILHLCYELAVQQSQRKDGNKNLPKFWAGQLQKAHECRYGRVGGNVDKLRAIMVHSRGILRNRDGFETAKYCFI